jgi:hypothetical protein
MNGKSIKKLSIFLFCALCAGIVLFLCFSSAANSEDDFTFKWILPLEYYEGTDFSEGRAWVREKKDGTWTLIDEKGNILKEGVEARVIVKYKDSFAKLVTEKRSQSSYLDRYGNLVFPSGTFKESVSFEGDGLFSKEENGLYGYIDIKGEWVIPPIYDDTFFSRTA